ncbi:hypothetical protein FA95DRAFT_654718 [Auriscalpium vulgare]|uniref:Uncharacterized protein n=1 Tax=Auriscalpium vulgare TaxID=40419 RepID=A0ACB8RCH4_9AGAM|nr:hypothetical protein FA95DRAFT_654718 [Auriscalpium vulgare]
MLSIDHSALPWISKVTGQRLRVQGAFLTRIELVLQYLLSFALLYVICSAAFPSRSTHASAREARTRGCCCKSANYSTLFLHSRVPPVASVASTICRRRALYCMQRRAPAL